MNEVNPVRWDDSRFCLSERQVQQGRPCLLTSSSRVIAWTSGIWKGHGAILHRAHVEVHTGTHPTSSSRASVGAHSWRQQRHGWGEESKVSRRVWEGWALDACSYTDFKVMEG